MDLDLDFFGRDFSCFAGFESDLDLRSWQVPDLELQIFLTTLLICYKTHMPNSSFESYAVIVHFLRL